MKKYLPLIILAISTSLLFGQQNLSTISTAGGFATATDGSTVSWTIGEVFSHTENSLIVTEGFQQGELHQKPEILLTATRVNNQHVRLNLKEIGTVNSNTFVIQRSIGDTNSFSTVSRIKNDVDAKNEIIIDANDSEQITHYRVIYFHKNKPQNTNLAQAEGMIKTIRVQTFPNPTTDYIKVQFEGKLDKATTIQIIAVNGNTVYSNSYNTIDNQVIAIPQVETFAPGSYILQVIGEDNEVLETVKFIKV